MAPKTLTFGSLNQITESKNTSITPLVQILGAKPLSQNRFRVVVWDTRDVCQHCIIVSETLNESDFAKYTVVRLEEFSLSVLPKKDNVQVILANQVSIIAQGSDVGRKLLESETWESSPDENRSMNTEAKKMNANTNRASTSPVKPNVPPASDGHLKNEIVSPIEAVSPFYTNWVIRARVTNKGQLRTYSNAKGAGKLFSFDVCDESGEIRITCFNAEVDRFYDIVEKGKIYLIAKGMVKPANKKFSSLNNDYEITLGSQSMIEASEDEAAPVPSMRFRFVPISNINQMSVGTSIDVAGIIKSVGDVETLISKKTQKELQKREIGIVDKSLHEVKLTLWNEIAKEFEGAVGQAVCVKSATIGDFRGKTLSSISNTIVEIDMPNVPEVNLLKLWWKAEGENADFTPLSSEAAAAGTVVQDRFIYELTPQLISSNATNGSFFTNITGTIMATSRSNNQLYKSCGNNGCMKKVTEGSEGVYYCSKCDRSSPNFDWRIMLSMDFADATGNCWVTAFHELSEKILSISTRELAELYENNQDEYLNIINQLRFKKFSARIGCRIEEYNNEKRVRITAYNIQTVTPAERIKKLATFLETASNPTAA